MTITRTKTLTHPTERELADYLSNDLDLKKREELESHIAGCGECLAAITAASESVEEFTEKKDPIKDKGNKMKKINIYLVLAIITFSLSFITPRFFVQLLVATLILGIKWVVDSKSTKMLVMIYEAWKNGGEKEASRILETIESGPKNRLKF